MKSGHACLGQGKELLLKNFTIPGKSVAMPADPDRPLQAAIVHPADDLKVSFDPGLVETLLDEVESKPGSLPLLQFALGEMWGRRENRKITLKSYLDIGEFRS